MQNEQEFCPEWVDSVLLCHLFQHVLFNKKKLEFEMKSDFGSFGALLSNFFNMDPTFIQETNTVVDL